MADIIRLVTRLRRSEFKTDAPSAAVASAHDAVELFAWRMMACKLRELEVHVRRYTDAMERLPHGAARNSALNRLAAALAQIELQFDDCSMRARWLQQRMQQGDADRSAADRLSI